MLSPKIEKALNEQVQLEAESSQIYLAMASWSEVEGYSGISAFLYKHSDEERMHMLKLVKYINERGGHGIIPQLKAPAVKYKGVRELFQQVYDHEVLVSTEINHLVDICLKEKDYTTHNFLQWYVSEQIEEESLARHILDKLKLIGADKSGLYMFDRDVSTMGGPAPGGGGGGRH
jgi:ferritin